MRRPRRSPRSCWRSPSSSCSSSICCRHGAAGGSRMADTLAPSLQAHAHRFRDASTESPIVRSVLIGIAVVFLLVFLLMPLAIVFYEALREGIGAFLTGITERDAL